MSIWGGVSLNNQGRSSFGEVISYQLIEIKTGGDNFPQTVSTIPVDSLVAVNVASSMLIPEVELPN